MLNLIGYGRGWLIGFPTLQADPVGRLGFHRGGHARAFRRGLDQPVFRSELRFRWGGVRDRGIGGAIGSAAVLLFSLVPATIIGISFTRVDPSDEIRDS